MNFNIVPFKSHFIQDQVKIGKKVTKNWKYYSQSTIDELKKTYSMSSFDPKTRFYAIENGKVIGFITSKIFDDNIAQIAPPIADSEDYEVSKKLLNECIDQLRILGVEQIRMTSSSSWGFTDQLVNEFKMSSETCLMQEYLDEIDKFRSILMVHDNLKEISTNTDLSIVNYDKKYLEQVAEILSQVIGYDKAFAMKILSEQNQLPNLKEEISKILISSTEQILGYIRGSLVEENHELILSLTPGYILSHKLYQFRKLLILSVLNAINPRVKRIRLIITKETLSQIEPLDLDKLNLNIELRYYTKEI